MRILPVLALALFTGCAPRATDRGANDTAPRLEPTTTTTTTSSASTPPSTRPDRATTTTPSTVAWPFRPAAVRFHPLSRIVTGAPEGRPVIETRLEFTDRAGDTTKAHGTLVVDLHELDARAESMQSSWDLDLTDLMVNERHYDVVTRTYLLRLVVDPAVMPATPELVARYTDAAGHTLEARITVR